MPEESNSNKPEVIKAESKPGTLSAGKKLDWTKIALTVVVVVVVVGIFAWVVFSYTKNIQPSPSQVVVTSRQSSPSAQASPSAAASPSASPSANIKFQQ